MENEEDNTLAPAISENTLESLRQLHQHRNEPNDENEEQIEDTFRDDGDGKQTSKSQSTATPVKMSRNKSRPHPATASKLEDQMNYEHLKSLQSVFQEADADNGGGLDIDEFREAVKKTMGSEIDDKELEVLFMKVDTNCDGTVDWDEYLSYMLLEYQEKDTMSTQIREQNPLLSMFSNTKGLSNQVILEAELSPACRATRNHRDTVVAITFCQNLSNRISNVVIDRENASGKYVMLSKEGQIGFYGTDFTLQKSITMSPTNDNSIVPMWLTSMVACSNVNMLAISSSEREISFYDACATKFERHFQLTGFRDPVLCMDYWFNSDDLNNCALVVGDSGGSVIVFRFYNAYRRGLFDIIPEKGILRKIPIVSIMKQRIPGAYCLMFQDIHTNWVNSARFFQLAQGLECFLSCSSTDDDSMYLGDLANMTYKAKYPGFMKLRSNRGCYFKARKGIICLDYSKDWNVIVTGSFDGVVRTWNPYSMNPTAQIKGHLTPVQHVIIIPDSEQIIACGRDRTIRILELRDHSATQVIASRTFVQLTPASHTISAMLYQKRYKVLLLGVTQVGVMQGTEASEGPDHTNAKSHNRAVSCVLYNKLFNQVVSAGHDSVVSVWDLNTGVKAIQFHTIHGVELTTMCFDPSERRLITGSRNGAIKIWNFNNGACLRTLREGNDSEVTGIVCIKQKIIAAGWTKRLSLYIDSRDDESEDDSHEWQEAHSDDILGLATFTHGSGVTIVASSSYDGDIFIWSLETGHILCRLNRMESHSPLNNERFQEKRRQTLESQIVSLPKMWTATPDSNEEQLIGASGNVTHDQRCQSVTRNNDKSFVRASGTLQTSKAPSAKLPRIPSRSGAVTTLQGFGEARDTPKRKSATGKGALDSHLRKPRTARSSTLKPSAGSMANAMFDHTRHQLNVLMGENTKNYWEADVAIEKLLFLQSRPHDPSTASLLASGALGWVHAWSVHPQGGLLGQFVAAHKDGESVLTMDTDEENKILITGDSTGYVMIWDIETYCSKDKATTWFEDSTSNDFLKKLGEDFLNNENGRMLSTRRPHKVNVVPPQKHLYFRAHSDSINDITYINKNKLFLTGCVDGTLRLWTINGYFLGTFGQKLPWSLSPSSGFPRMPGDIKRVASANTLKVFQAGYTSWKHANALVSFFYRRGARKRSSLLPTYRGSSESNKDMSEVDSSERVSTISDEEVERNYKQTVERMSTSKVLGNWYQPKRRHRVLPKIDLKPHLNNFHVHACIPFTSLEETVDIAVPEMLKEKWRHQKQQMQVWSIDNSLTKQLVSCDASLSRDSDIRPRAARSSLNGIRSNALIGPKSRFKGAGRNIAKTLQMMKSLQQKSSPIPQ